ncbi:MAG: NAD(P)-dependent oxidoreductase [Mobilicoccus sp.]|nr:NAD(P)-dependent oxidoreductase [Mobilicoccus sp.]
MTRLLWPDLLDAPDLPGVEILTYDTSEPLPEEAHDAEIFVVWARGGHLLSRDAQVLTRLRLVQSFAAGTDVIEEAGFAPEVIVSSGVGLHDATVAEHTLTLVLTLVRRIPDLLQAQADHRWHPEYSGVQPLHHPGPVSTLIGANVVVWGFGSIAATLAPMLAALGATVRGIARSAGTRHGFEVVGDAEADRVLADCDVLISILPGGDATRHVIDAACLDRLPDHAYVVNVGRGSVLDESALVEALQQGRIGGAALDVMETEPLPASDPLWSAPRIVLTPHCAGGRPVGYETLVSANVEALLGGGELRNVVSRSPRP